MSNTIKPNHILVAGTGRAGTTFLMSLFTELDLNTGFDKENYKEHMHDFTKGGLEYMNFKIHPYILKDPNFSLTIPEILQSMTIDMVYVPVRNMADAATSRVLNKDLPGGLWLTLEDKEQHEKLCFALGKLMGDLIFYNIPYKLIKFEEMIISPKYLFKKLEDLLTEVSYLQFEEAYARATLICKR